MHPNSLRFVAFAALVLQAAGTAISAETAPAAADNSTTSYVTVSEARRSELVSKVPVSGTLVPREEVLVNAQISGYAIEELKVDIGDTVSEGDVLAVINDSTLAAQLAQADAELARATAAVSQASNQIQSTGSALSEAEAQLERTTQLKNSGNATQALLDQAKSAAAAARASAASADDGLSIAQAQQAQAQSQRDLAELNLSRTRIKAPVSGIISARNAKLGAIVASTGDPLFRIVRNGEIELEAEVIETALGLIHDGDTVHVSIAGQPAASVEGRVRLISPTVDQATRLGLIRVSLDTDSTLRAGIFASASVEVDRHQGITVPSSAVVTTAEGDTVQVVKDATVERREVTAGILTEDGRREIVIGLDAGETVITRAGAFFRNGDKVQVVAQADADADGKSPAQTPAPTEATGTATQPAPAAGAAQ